MDFQSLWLDAISEEKNELDPAVPHVFSSSDMPVASHCTALSQSQEDAEFILVSCQAASHTHHIDLCNVRGIELNDHKLKFPAFEECCQHPMLSHLDSKTRLHMQDRCQSGTIMTLSFTSNVTKTGRFISTSDGIRVTGTNLEEDRILCVTSKRWGNPPITLDESHYKGVLHRMILNSYENIRRRLHGFSHPRCSNVSRSAALALFKVGEAMVVAVQNITTAINAGVGSEEVVWEEGPVIIYAGDLRSIEGFESSKDCEGMIDPIVDLLLTAANRDYVNARKGFPPRINLALEENCIERRLMDYYNAVILNHSSTVSRYAIMLATLEALVEIGGIESTLISLCTSSMAMELSSRKHFYEAMHVEEVLGLTCQELASISKPLTGNGNSARSSRTRNQIAKACDKVTLNRKHKTVKVEEVLHDPDLLKGRYNTEQLELDLLVISDHLIGYSKSIWHDTEIRMLNLLAIGAELIYEELEGENKCARFYGITVKQDGEQSIAVESDSEIAFKFVNLNALTNHTAVFGAMLNFMLGGPLEEELHVKNPVLNIAERTVFVRNAFKQLQFKGLSLSRAIETAVMSAKVLSIRRAMGFNNKVMADEAVLEALENIRGCIFEEETGLDIADIVQNGDEEVVDHYGVDSTTLRGLRVDTDTGRLTWGNFKLLDYTKYCHRYGKLDVHEDAVAFSARGQKYFAYCERGRIHVRKRGLWEEPRRRLGGDKIGLTLFGTGMVIELKEARPLKSDAEAMDMIMERSRKRSQLGLWVWSKILKGNIKYKATDVSGMWNRDARSVEANVIGRWAVPKWILGHMLVLMKNGGRGDTLMVQGGDNMPLFELKDQGSTFYSCRQVSSMDIRRRDYRKALFTPQFGAGGDNR